VTQEIPRQTRPTRRWRTFDRPVVTQPPAQGTVARRSQRSNARANASCVASSATAGLRHSRNTALNTRLASFS
jgi:hypothetical protein